MPSSITCSTEILTLTTSPILFILVGVLCELTMVPSVYILLSPQEEEVHYSSWGHRYIYNSAAHSSKRFKLLSDIIWLCQGYWWIRKNTNKEFSCVTVFIIRPSSTFHFVFGFNEGSLSNLFLRLLNLRKFMVLYLGCGCVTFDFTTQSNEFESLLTWLQRPPNIFQNFEKDL